MQYHIERGSRCHAEAHTALRTEEGTKWISSPVCLAGARWLLEYAKDINVNGMILGRVTVQGLEHDFVLIPVPVIISIVGRLPTPLIR
jgi:hypothetical protein